MYGNRKAFPSREGAIKAAAKDYEIRYTAYEIRIMSLIKSYKISFVPGPVHVSDAVQQAMIEPTLSHRSAEFSTVFGECAAALRKMLSLTAKDRVYISSSSATGMMEAGIRNGVKNKVASFVCGAFSKRWAEIPGSCQKDSDAYEVEWGQAVTPEVVDYALASGQYDALTCVHNETSTGVMNPVKEIASMVREKYPDVAVMVDCVSSMAAVDIRPEVWGLDMALAGVQKAFALPPGLAVASVSERLFEKSKTLEGKGVYFDFEAFEKYAVKNQTPNTPSLPLIFALHFQLHRILKESMDVREARHRKMAQKVQDWARENFALFADEKYLSPTVTCIRNTRADSLPTNKLLSAWKKRGYIVAGGYGPLKGETFRIGHMGDITEANVDELLGAGDEILKA